MAKTITVDPVTRIEGHLRVDVEVDQGRVSNAWSSSTMWRGIEKILRGRDARDGWFFTQRFCGVCTTVHAMASVRAVEDALNMKVPLNAQLIRNLILIAHALHDHIVHFYHLSALDWVDITTLPKADVKAAAKAAKGLSDWTGNGEEELADLQKKIKGFISEGRLGVFSNGYWGHPAMRLSPEVNLIAVLHYFQALEFQRKANQVVAFLGGKTPHIQNLTVGGVMNAVEPDSAAALNTEKIYKLKELLEEVITFVHKVYVPDACLVAGAYNDWFKYGAGHKNYLAIPDLPLDEENKTFGMPGGIIMGGNLKEFREIKDWKDSVLRDNVAEDVTHAWYRGEKPLHPYEGETNESYTEWSKDGKYSWVKGPRYMGQPMEVGPLACVLAGYAAGHEPTQKWTSAAIETISKHAGRKIALGEVMSTMGRYGARAIRCAVLADMAMDMWKRLSDNVIGKGDVRTFNEPKFPKGEVTGVGFHEAPRGTLSHWVKVKDGKYSNYQAVVPTTWNASPRDNKGVRGPYEESLMRHQLADAKRPLEVLRTIHSFDPCMACAVHTLDPEGNEEAVVRVL